MKIFKKIKRYLEDYITIHESNDVLDGDLMEYIQIDQETTGLKVDVFVDDGLLSLFRKPKVLARNGYKLSDSEFIEFEISKDAKILNPNIDYKISYDDIFDIQDFITENKDLLLSFFERNVDEEKFLEAIKKPNYDRN